MKKKSKWDIKRDEKISSLKEKISKDELYDYYILKNNRWEDTQKEFDISNSELVLLVREYDIRKPKTLSAKHTKKTKLEKYGNENYNNKEKRKQTNIKKYGVDNPFKSKECMKNVYDLKEYIYGKGNANNWKKNHITRINNSGSLQQSYREGQTTYENTCLEKYGVHNPSMIEEVKDKIKNSVKDTFIEKYGVPNYWLKPDAKRSNGSKNSVANNYFATLLDNDSIEYEQEFILNNFIYDFKIGNTLIEINPTPTHNSTWNPYSDKGIDKYYHLDKSKNAFEEGYNCIHVFDWDDKNKIISLLKQRDVIYARNCIIKEIKLKDSREYLDKYHLQNNAKSSIKLGLYHKDDLVSVMTFGKPRYNKNYEYELIRYCSHYLVIGGESKIFKYFIKKYYPRSIISYCDNSKFKGNIYNQLGFIKKNSGTPSKHWYNIKTKEHILDSLLRQRGFDQLFGASYGKGTSNNDLMLLHNFVEVYDCGQSVFSYTI